MTLSPTLAFMRLFHELRVQTWPEAVRHHALDDARDLGLWVAFAIDEPDRHALIRGAVTVNIGVCNNTLDLAMNGERLRTAGHVELEQEFGAHRKRFACLDECTAARDVLGVVGEERVESLVFDLELDRPPLGGTSLRFVVDHISLYQD